MSQQFGSFRCFRKYSTICPKWQFRPALLLPLALVALAPSLLPAAEPGLAIVPADAAFLSSSLRGREQYDRIVGSNAFAALRELPAVKKAFDEIAKQQAQPGNPLTIAAMLLQMPENQQAIALLQDMVATDTFVFGTPSWIQAAGIFKKIQQAQQAGNIAALSKGTGIDFNPQETTARLIVKALAENTDDIVIPDLVWGFKTTQQEAAETQLKRLELTAKMFTQAQPLLANAVKRQTIGKGDFVTLTVRPDPNLLRMLSADAVEDLDVEEEVNAILTRVGELEFVIAIGLLDDHVILSVGGGTDHLEKLGRDSDSLLKTDPFAKIREADGKPLTGISYLSKPLAAAVMQSADDFEQINGLITALVKAGKLPDEAKADAEQLVEQLVAGYTERLPLPGPWLAYSYLTDTGYAGEVWNWAQNLPWDGSKPLDLLEFTGGSPFATLAFRTETDPESFEAFVAWIASARDFAVKYLATAADEDAKERFSAFEEHVLPLGGELADTIRGKFLPALKNGQFGLVLDADSTTTKLQQALPTSADPLPIIEPAIVLAIDDEEKFREGLSDLFALSDKLLTAIRKIDNDAVPSEYQIPDPTQTEVDGGKLWTFALPGTGLDEQVQLSIGIGEKVAVFSLVPDQAKRLLVAKPLKTAASLSALDSKLAGAAALDWVGLIDVIEPWAVYLARCGIVQNKGGRLDSESTIGPDVETEETKKDIAQLVTLLRLARCLRAAAAETSVEDAAIVTRWQNQIEDLPAE
jgi:hypothetical protein